MLAKRPLLTACSRTRHDAWHGLGPVGQDDPPEEIPAIRDDLCAFDEPRVRAWAVGWRSPFGADDGDEIRYVLDFLERAKEFVKALADDGRGMVYMIG